MKKFVSVTFAALLSMAAMSATAAVVEASVDTVSIGVYPCAGEKCR